MAMKRRMKMKNRSHRHDINRLSSSAPSSDPFMTNASVSTSLVLLYMVASNFHFIGTVILFAIVSSGFFSLIIL